MIAEAIVDRLTKPSLTLKLKGGSYRDRLGKKVAQWNGHCVPIVRVKWVKFKSSPGSNQVRSIRVRETRETNHSLIKNKVLKLVSKSNKKSKIGIAII